MEASTLEERLRDQRIANTAAHVIGLTIRPTHAGVAATLPTSLSRPPRPLPRISVDPTTTVSI